ncbi:MAG: hydrogenase maturation protease [Candidatus Zixiibacteriota bacterium]
MKCLVIGIGNPFRRDDGVGVKVAEAIAAANIPDCEVGIQSGEGAALMDCWRDASRVIVIDAVRSRSAPGKIHRIDAAAGHVPSDFFHYSSHAFGLAEAVEMSRALGQLPKSLHVFGIEGQDFAEGVGLSPEIDAAANECVFQIYDLLTAVRAR